MNSDRGTARLDAEYIAAVVEQMEADSRLEQHVEALIVPDDQWIDVLRQRMKYLGGRIKAKKDVGWETQWDERERNALEWVLGRLGGPMP